MTRSWIMCAALAASASGVHPAPAQPPLAEALRKQAPQLIKQFEEKGYQSVGVLKFLAQHENEAKAPNHNMGDLNLMLARYLERVLAMSIDPNAKKPLWIIKDASAVAKVTSGANQLTIKGRQALLNAEYPMKWIDKSVKPDALLTGTARVSTDLRSLTIAMEVFDQKTKEPYAAGEFTAAIEPYMLAGIGLSYPYRNPVFGEKAVPKKKARDDIYKEADKVRKDSAYHADTLKNPPVELQIFYGKTLIPIESAIHEGQSRFVIPEPAQDQEVRFILKHDGSDQTYAIVLKVNGQNTIEKQTRPDFYCHAWVLAPNQPQGLIKGYQVGNKTERFKVLSEAESRQIDYGEQTGTITMNVFREAKTKKPKVNPFEEKPEQTIERLTAELPDLPKNAKPATTPQALLYALLRGENRVRGLIVPGKQEDNPVETVVFQRDPDPIFPLVIHYRPR